MTFVGWTLLKLSKIIALVFMLLLVTGNGKLLLAQDDERSYSLPEVIGLAIDHNPRPAGAIGVIDTQQGLVVQAGAYPNPTIVGRGGQGSIRDSGVLGPGVFSKVPPT